MPTAIDNLKTRRDQVAADLAALVSKPDYGIDGQSVQWTAHRESLRKEFRELTEIINSMEPAEGWVRAYI